MYWSYKRNLSLIKAKFLMPSPHRDYIYKDYLILLTLYRDASDAIRFSNPGGQAVIQWA